MKSKLEVGKTYKFRCTEDGAGFKTGQIVDGVVSSTNMRNMVRVDYKAPVGWCYHYIETGDSQGKMFVLVEEEKILKLEVGKSYFTVDGNKATILVNDLGESMP